MNFDLTLRLLHVYRDIIPAPSRRQGKIPVTGSFANDRLMFGVLVSHVRNNNRQPFFVQ